MIWTFQETTDAPVTNGEADTTSEEKTDESLKRKDAPTEVKIFFININFFNKFSFDLSFKLLTLKLILENL